MTRKMERRTDDRLKSMSAAENVALGTAAGAMALGVLASTDERIAAHAAAAKDSPTQSHAGGSANADLSASATAQANDGAHTAAVHVNAAPSLAIENNADQAKIHDQPHGQPAAPSHGAEPDDATAPAVSDPPVHQTADAPHGTLAHDTAAASAHEPIAPPVSTSLDGAMASLNEAMNTLSATLHQVPGVPQVSQMMSDTFNDVTHWTASATSTAAGSLVSAVFDQPPHIDIPQMPMIDTSPLVQTGLAPLPVTIAFMGQPQPDPHDGGHDAAFSALGLHHF